MHVGMSSTGFSWTIKLTIKCEVQAFDENSPLYWGGMVDSVASRDSQKLQ